MLNKLQKRNSQKSSQGFTIIEVMIVLAIAGMILLIVFLAVPALQRSSRNTQRKTDIGRISSAATTLVANNNGTVGVTVITGGAAGTLAKETGTTLAIYQTSGFATTKDGAQTITPTLTSINVVTNATCGAATPVAAPTKFTTLASPKRVAIVYATEGGGGAIPNCVDQ